MTKKAEGLNLNEKQKLFCDNFVSKEFFANGFESYVDAYNVDLERNGAYESAKSAASRLLKNKDVCDYINSLLDDAGLNDNFVDKQLLFLINQQTDFGSKIAAIREYNKLKSRIVERVSQKIEIDTANKINISKDGDSISLKVEKQKLPGQAAGLPSPEPDQHQLNTPE